MNYDSVNYNVDASILSLIGFLSTRKNESVICKQVWSGVEDNYEDLDL